MEAFSYDKQDRPYLLDSSFMFLPNTNTHVSSSAANINNHDHNHNVTNMSCFLERSTDNNSYNSCFSPHDQHHPFYNQPDRTVDVLSSVNTSSGSTTSTTKLSICSNNSSSSALTEHINHMDKRKNIFQQQSKVKGKKQKKETVSIDCVNMKLKKKVIMSCKKKRRSDDKKKNYEESSDQRNDEAAAPSGCIYVRARRGQATDSHSLAERVRREKISQRMNLLQALVPGCHKVMGKANMLDEVISYVQSLQNQVEFLSLKIACVNPTLYDNGMNLLDSLIFKPEVLNQNQLQRNISRLEATEQPNVLQQQNHTHITNTNICNTYGYSYMDNSNFMSLPQWKTLVSSPHTQVSPGTDLEELC